LKTILPSHGVVGYIGAKNLSTDDAKLHHGLTAYVLAPIMVEHSIQPDIIIGNFPDAHAQQVHQIAVPNGRVHIQDFGDGVFLFTRKKQQ